VAIVKVEGGKGKGARISGGYSRWMSPVDVAGGYIATMYPAKVI